MNIKHILAVLIISGFAIGTYAFLRSEARENKPTSNQPASSPETQIALLDPSPTPFPYEELTIPHLRKKNYKSSLAQLNKAYDRSSYTGYTTSYTSENLKINSLITIPKGNKPQAGWPAVVFVHGYIPPASYTTLTRYIDHVDYLARNGIVVLKIDLRGHGDSEGEAGGAYYSADYVVDTLNAYAALENADFVDTARIGLWGHSMAGNVVMRAATVKPTIPAVVIWAGAVYSYVDFREYGISDNSYRPPPPDSPSRKKRQEMLQKAGEISDENEFWKQVAPSTFFSDLKGAIQIHHAVDDPVVTIEYSRNLDRMLTNAGIPHQLFEYPSGGHNLTGTSFSKAMAESVRLFTTN